MTPASTPPDAPAVAQLVARWLAGEAAAFREIVQRYHPLVRSTALRRTEGRTHLAEDATQAVFIDLARRLPGLKADERLGGWLYARAVRAAADIMKCEARRKDRERAAALHTEPAALPADWEDLAAELHEALASLRPQDRDAVVLRHIEGRDFRTLGSALGLSEEAAQKRVSRALEKLRVLLSRRRAVVPAAAVLASGLMADARAAQLAMPDAGAQLTAGILARAGTVSGAVRLWAHARAAMLGIGVSGLVWAWPAAARMAAQPGDGAPQPAVAAASPSSAMRYPAFPAVPPMATGLSVDQIVQAIAALSAGPATRNSSDQFEFYKAELGQSRAGEALRKLAKLLRPFAMENFHQRGWQRALVMQWADADLVAALNFLLEHSPADLRLFYGSLAGLSGRTERNLEQLTQWWVGLLQEPSKSRARRLSSLLRSEAWNQLLSRAVNDRNSAALGILAEAADSHRLPFLHYAAERIAADDPEALEKLNTIAALIHRMESPALRDQLQRAILARMGSTHFEEASQIVDGIPDPAQQLAYAELICRPPQITNSRDPDPTLPRLQPEYRTRADWWLRHAPAERQKEVALKIGEAWLTVDPDWGLPWLGTKVTPDAMQEFLLQSAQYPIHLLGHYPKGPNVIAETRKLRKVMDHLRSQFPQSARAIGERLLSENSGLPGTANLKSILLP